MGIGNIPRYCFNYITSLDSVHDILNVQKVMKIRDKKSDRKPVFHVELCRAARGVPEEKLKKLNKRIG